MAQVAVHLHFSYMLFKNTGMFKVYFIQKNSKRFSLKIVERKTFLLQFLFLIIACELPHVIFYKKKLHALKSFFAAANFLIIQRKRLFFSSS